MPSAVLGSLPGVPAVFSSRLMFASAKGEYRCFNCVRMAGFFSNPLELSMLALIAASMLFSSLTGAFKSNSAVTPAATSISDGKQNRSFNRKNRLNSSTTMGRNRSNTNVATIVTSGIETLQTSPSGLVPSGIGPLPSPEIMIDPGGLANATPSVGRACAANTLRSGSWTVTGRLLVPSRSNGAASLYGSVGWLQNSPSGQGQGVPGGCATLWRCTKHHTS